MNFLLINSSPNKNGVTYHALEEAKKIIDDLGGKSIIYWLGNSPRYACRGCGECKNTKKCIYNDLSDIENLLSEADGIIFGTPTHYAGASPALTAVLSRLCMSNKSLLQNKPAATIATARRGGAINSVTEVNKFFGFCSMITVGGCYPPIAYGKTADPEGLQNARSLARMLFYVSSCIKNGKENGIFPPEEESKIKTNI